MTFELMELQYITLSSLCNKILSGMNILSFFYLKSNEIFAQHFEVYTTLQNINRLPSVDSRGVNFFFKGKNIKFLHSFSQLEAFN